MLLPDGGAGTTAIGLYLGKPTIIVPFFGDQVSFACREVRKEHVEPHLLWYCLAKPFWGNMVHQAGAGPEPIPQKKLTVDLLAEGIKYCSTASAKAAAGKMGEQIRSEVSQCSSAEPSPSG